MSQHPIESATTNELQKATEEFFTSGTLSEKISQATILRELPGFHLFETAVPWKIEVGGAQITGLSEGLLFAITDIHSQLVAIQKDRALETPLLISIDEKRLPPRPQQGVRLKANEAT